MNTAQARQEGRALEPHELDAMRAFVEQFGEESAAQQFLIGRQTIVRALSGLPLQRGTVALIRLTLEKQHHAAPATPPTVSNNGSTERTSQVPPNGDNAIPNPVRHGSHPRNAPNPAGRANTDHRQRRNT